MHADWGQPTLRQHPPWRQPDDVACKVRSTKRAALARSGNTAQLTLPDGSKLALQRFVFDGTTPTGRDLASLASLDLKPILSSAGSWVPIDAAGAALIPFWGNIRTGASQVEGVAMAGWAYSGFSNTATSVTSVRAVLLQQQADGRLQEATAAVLGNPATNGAGSVLVADFNGDGREDLVFPAHNESPFLWQASTAFMSRADGGFTRITLPDAVMNHDSRVVQLGGKTRIIARSFGGSGNNGQGAGFNVIYTWNGSNFSVDTSLGDPGGMSVVAGKFGGDANDWIVIADTTFGATPPSSLARRSGSPRRSSGRTASWATPAFPPSCRAAHPTA